MVKIDCPNCEESQAFQTETLPEAPNALTRSVSTELYEIPIEEMCSKRNQLDPKPIFPRLKSVDASIDDICEDLEKYPTLGKLTLNQLYAIDKNLKPNSLNNLAELEDIAKLANESGDTTPDGLNELVQKHPSLEDLPMNNYNNVIENTPDKGGKGFSLKNLLTKYPVLAGLGIGAFATGFISGGFGGFSLANITKILGNIPSLFSFGTLGFLGVSSLIPPLGDNALNLTDTTKSAFKMPALPRVPSIKLPTPSIAVPPMPGMPPIAIPPSFPALPSIPALPSMAALAGASTFLNPFKIIDGGGAFDSLKRTVNKNSPELGGVGNIGGTARTATAMQAVRGDMFDIRADTEGPLESVTHKETAFESGQQVEQEPVTKEQQKAELSAQADEQAKVTDSLPGTAQSVVQITIPEAISANDVTNAVSSSGLQQNASYTAIAVALANNRVIPNTAGCITLVIKILKQKNLDLNSPASEIAGALNAAGFRKPIEGCGGPVRGLTSDPIEPSPATSLLPKSESSIQDKTIADNYFLVTCEVEGGVDKDSLNIEANNTITNQETGEIANEELSLVKDGELVQEGSTMIIRNNISGCSDIVITVPRRSRDERNLNEVRTVNNVRGRGLDLSGNEISLEKSCPKV